jgi:preprotein translocase subunit SecB
MTEQNHSHQDNVNFSIQRIYIKDLSFESPETPKIFLNSEWRPEVNIELSIKHNKIDDGIYDVILLVTATVKQESKVAVVVEVKQAGIFAIEGIEGEALEHLLASYCPNILFPYAREAISDAVTRGGFPQLLLAPVNFDALYEESKKQTATA